MRILIADDNTSTRIVLRKNLHDWGYEVVEASDGAAAWELLEGEDCPRVAILDWMMPILDGVTLCERLQQRVDRPFVYTVLLTSRNRKQDRLHALERGAHDFHTKPVDPDDLRCRLAVGRRLVAANDQVQEYATHMEELATERAEQLIHSERLAVIGTLMAGLAHEINNPLTYLLGNLDLLKRYWKMVEPVVAQAAPALADELRRKVERVRQGVPAALDSTREGAQRVQAIVAGLLRFSRKGENGREPTDLSQCIENALRLCHSQIKYHAKTRCAIAPDLPAVPAYPEQIEQVLVNLLRNAADATRPRGRGHIGISAERRNGNVVVMVEDDGPGLPAETLARIWEPFYTTKAKDEGTGLGLAISRRLVEEHQGRLEAENRAEGGARFTLALPVEPPPA